MRYLNSIADAFLQYLIKFIPIERFHLNCVVILHNCNLKVIQFT